MEVAETVAYGYIATRRVCWILGYFWYFKCCCRDISAEQHLEEMNGRVSSGNSCDRCTISFNVPIPDSTLSYYVLSLELSVLS